MKKDGLSWNFLYNEFIPRTIDLLQQLAEKPLKQWKKTSAASYDGFYLQWPSLYFAKKTAVSLLIKVCKKDVFKQYLHISV